jgi:hypothetical protein
MNPVLLNDIEDDSEELHEAPIIGKVGGMSRIS